MLNPASTEEQQAKDALTKHHMALDALMREFPEFPKLCRKLEGLLAMFAREKNVPKSSLKFGDVKWHNDGHVVCKINAGKIDLIGVNRMHDDMVKAVTGIGHQLVGAFAEKSSLRLISFTGVSLDNEGTLKFRVRHCNKPQSPQDIKGI